jgi:hypothetical protein
MTVAESHVHADDGVSIAEFGDRRSERAAGLKPLGGRRD